LTAETAEIAERGREKRIDCGDRREGKREED